MTDLAACEGCGDKPAKLISDFVGYQCKTCFVEEYFEAFRVIALPEGTTCSRREDVERDWENLDVDSLQEQ